MLALTVVLCVLVLKFVDLRPQVGQNFFFSSDDPSFQEDAQIDRIFPSGSQLIVSVASPDISSNSYLERLGRLTQRIETVEGVSSVDSLTDGPKNFEDAEKSPFWKRLLIAENGRSSNVVVFMPAGDSQLPIHRIEAITNEFDAKDFRAQIAGAPYVADMIQRSLSHDFHVFSLTSVLLFWDRNGSLISIREVNFGHARYVHECGPDNVAAAGGVWTKDRHPDREPRDNCVRHYVVTSRIYDVQLADFWPKKQQRFDTSDLGAKAWRMTTLPASFWSMVCSIAGIWKSVDRPCQASAESWHRRNRWHGRGIRGRLSYISSISCLGRTKTHGEDYRKKCRQVLGTKVRLGIGDDCFGVRRAGLWNRPAEYRSKSSRLLQERNAAARGKLAYVDHAMAGSNPLSPRSRGCGSGGRLDTKEEYQNMWDRLQDALENYQSTGTEFSPLPILMDEITIIRFAFLLKSGITCSAPFSMSRSTIRSRAHS